MAKKRLGSTRGSTAGGVKNRPRDSLSQDPPLVSIQSSGLECVITLGQSSTDEGDLAQVPVEVQMRTPGSGGDPTLDLADKETKPTVTMKAVATRTSTGDSSPVLMQMRLPGGGGGPTISIQVDA